MTELTVISGGEPTAEQVAAIVAAAEAVLASEGVGAPAKHPAYASEWWQAGRDSGLERWMGEV